MNETAAATLPVIGTMPYIGAQALYRINPNHKPGEPFGKTKKGRDVVHALEFISLSEVAAKDFPTEAMLVSYRRRDNGPLPRLTKACQGLIDLVCDYAIFDIDLSAQFGETGKLPWTKLSPDQQTIMEKRIAAVMAALAAKDASPVCWYRTKNGLRFIHLLHQSINVAGLELLLPILAEIYASAGLTVDPACGDWTRAFKAPCCTLEDGKVTSEQDWFEIHLFPESVTLVTDRDVLLAVVEKKAAGEVSTEARLEVGHAREQIEMDGRLTTNGLLANYALRGDPELFGLCFGSTPFMAPEGTRHDDLTRITGKLTKRCAGQPWATESFLYALIAPKVAEIGPDEEWLDKAWEMIGSYLAADRAELAAKVTEVREKLAEKAVVAPNAMKIFADGVRKWNPDAVGLDDDDVVQLVKDARLAIATSQETNNNYLLQPDGFYGGHPVAQDKVSLVVRRSGMEWLIPTEIETLDAKGNPRVSPRSWPQFLNEDAFPYASTSMRCVHRGNYLGKDEAGVPQFVISPFWLRDIEPKFDQRVETWLTLAATDGEFNEMILSLAYLLAFQWGPTAAVALIGPRSVGKKLLATGLAECINTMQCCPGSALVSRFNGSLTTSPIIWVDEGLPKGKDGIDFADRFRNLVTGGKLDVERKGKEIIQVAGVHRVLLTANNYEVIAKLGEDAPRSGDDLDAISERLVTFQLQGRAAEYLGTLDTRGWIAGDNGSPSDLVVARHLMWHLYNTVQWENGAPKKLGRRLLYEGDQDGGVRGIIDAADVPLNTACHAVSSAIEGSLDWARFHLGRLWIEPTGFKAFLAGEPSSPAGRLTGLQTTRRIPLEEQKKYVEALHACTTSVRKEITGKASDGRTLTGKNAVWRLWTKLSRLEEITGRPLSEKAKTVMESTKTAN